MRLSLRAPYLILLVPFFAAAAATAADDGFIWIEGDTSKAVDVINIANDGKPDLRIIGWLNGGSIPLKAGKMSITFTMHSGNNHHGGIDCFVLTKVPFTPNGAMKPGQKLGSADPGWWAFEPDPDPFTKNALLDLRSLNERVAGEKSGKILVQAFSEEKMYGFTAANGVIKDAGRVPINVRDIQATVIFSNSAGLKAMVLDPNGYAAGEAMPLAGNPLTLQRTAIYTVVTR